MQLVVLFNVGAAMISILNGDIDTAYHRRDEFQQYYYYSSPKLRAMIQSIYSHYELIDCSFDNSLDCIFRTLEFYSKVHYTSNHILLSTLLSILSMYKILEIGRDKASKPSKESTGSFLVRKLTSMSQKDKEKRPSMMKNFENMRTTVKKLTSSSMDLNGDEVSMQVASLPLKPRVRKLVTTIQKSLYFFMGHSIYKPIELLLNGLLTLCSDTIASTDICQQFRDWMRVYDQEETETNQYIYAVIGIKCWVISGKNPEWLPERNLGLAILKENKISSKALMA
jgi:hypothetical protein